MFAKDQGCAAFFETSAKEGIGIKELFNRIGADAYKKRNVRESRVLKPSDQDKSKKKA